MNTYSKSIIWLRPRWIFLQRHLGYHKITFQPWISFLVYWVQVTWLSDSHLSFSPAFIPHLFNKYTENNDKIIIIMIKMSDSASSKQRERWGSDCASKSGNHGCGALEQGTQLQNCSLGNSRLSAHHFVQGHQRTGSNFRSGHGVCTPRCDDVTQLNAPKINLHNVLISPYNFDDVLY